MKMTPHIIPLPIHFKLPGRSYSQIGRKGNVALYSVYGDYLVVGLQSDCLPYTLIGFELVVIKTEKGKERYPRPEEFGHSAWSIPKSFFAFSRIASRLCFARHQLAWSALKAVLDRSQAPETPQILAAGAA